MNRSIPGLLVLIAAVSATGADPVYKSIDANGNVSYGDTAAGGAWVVEEVPIAPPPSQEAVLDAQLIGARIQDEAEKLEAERLIREGIEADRKAQEAARLAEQQAAAEAEAAEAAELERLAMEEQKRQRKSGNQRAKQARAAAARKAALANPMINMAPGAPLLNIPGPAE